MGIKNLNQLFNRMFPDIFKELHISSYSFKKIAVDTSIYLYRFKSSYGEFWLKYFLMFVSSLRENNIHPVFIFDTGAAPPEKEKERVKRREKRDYIKRKKYELQECLDHYESTNEILPAIESFKEYKILQDVYVLNVENIRNEIEKIEKQLIYISSKDYSDIKEILDILKIEYFDAPMEAETMCTELCKKGIVSAVLSEDTDCLTYGCCKLLTKYNYKNGLCTELSIDYILEKLEFTQEQFLDLCIMCGTDYNENIPKIGPSKSYKLLKKYSSLDRIKEYTLFDTEILNFIRVRDIFKNYKESNVVKLDYCGIPSKEELQSILERFNIDIELNILENSYSPSKVVFEE